MTDGNRVEVTRSIFLWIMGNAEDKVILLKSALLGAQERKMRVLCWVLLPLLLRSSSGMCRGAGDVMPMAINAQLGRLVLSFCSRCLGAVGAWSGGCSSAGGSRAG